MNDILRFEYLELKELNKTVVYVKEHKLSKIQEEWVYNDILFLVKKCKDTANLPGEPKTAIIFLASLSPNWYNTS